MGMAIGCFAVGAIFGAPALMVFACCAVAADPVYRPGEPLTKEEWKAGLNQEMKDRGIHL